MAIIQYGSFDSFSATARVSDLREFDVRSAVRGLETISVLREATRKAQPVPIEFDVSDSPRGLALKSIRLTKGFEGFLGNLFNQKNEVYFLTWAYDFSGNPPVIYPPPNAQAQDSLIPLRPGDFREFLGTGIVLFPARKITAGLVVRIQLWESDQGGRNFGKAMAEVSNTMKTSELSNLLSLISLAAPTITQAGLIKDAGVELANAIGLILQANGDDYADFYEGYYPAALTWSEGEEPHTGYASEITLTRLASLARQEIAATP